MINVTRLPGTSLIKKVVRVISIPKRQTRPLSDKSASDLASFPGYEQRATQTLVTLVAYVQDLESIQISSTSIAL